MMVSMVALGSGAMDYRMAAMEFDVMGSGVTVMGYGVEIVANIRTPELEARVGEEIAFKQSHSRQRIPAEVLFLAETEQKTRAITGVKKPARSGLVALSFQGSMLRIGASDIFNR